MFLLYKYKYKLTLVQTCNLYTGYIVFQLDKDAMFNMLLRIFIYVYVRFFKVY